MSGKIQAAFILCFPYTCVNNALFTLELPASTLFMRGGDAHALQSMTSVALGFGKLYAALP